MKMDNIMCGCGRFMWDVPDVSVLLFKSSFFDGFHPIDHCAMSRHVQIFNLKIIPGN